MTKKRYPFRTVCYGVNPKEALNFFLSLLIVISFSFSLFFPSLLFLGLAALFFHLFFYRKFYLPYLLAEKGPFFLIEAILAMQLIYLTKALSSAVGLFLIHVIRKDYFF